MGEKSPKVVTLAQLKTKQKNFLFIFRWRHVVLPDWVSVQLIFNDFLVLTNLESNYEFSRNMFKKIIKKIKNRKKTNDFNKNVLFVLSILLHRFSAITELKHCTRSEHCL
jgi:hypothetical protein